MSSESFSTVRHCDTCGQNKDWKQYHMDVGMCAQCWRKTLSGMASEGPKQHHSKKKNNRNMEDLMTFLNATKEDATS